MIFGTILITFYKDKFPPIPMGANARLIKVCIAKEIPRNFTNK